VDHSTLDDTTLMRLVALRQTGALDELYGRYSRLVFGLALRMLRDEAHAEEVTLDVFATLWTKASTYRGDKASVSTWLGSLARNRAIDRLRREKVRPSGTAVEWEDALDNIPAAASTEAEAELAMKRREVQAALTALPEEQRRALEMAYFGGYSHYEIAETLDIPVGTVKTRIRLAMQKLRDSLSEG
jgi:RNA polymerase sigma-70 factor (ECF subfamily)